MHEILILSKIYNINKICLVLKFKSLLRWSSDASPLQCIVVNLTLLWRTQSSVILSPSFPVSHSHAHWYFFFPYLPYCFFFSHNHYSKLNIWGQVTHNNTKLQYQMTCMTVTHQTNSISHQLLIFSFLHFFSYSHSLSQCTGTVWIMEHYLKRWNISDISKIYGMSLYRSTYYSHYYRFILDPSCLFWLNVL